MDELNIYSSSRIGMLKENQNLITLPDIDLTTINNTIISGPMQSTYTRGTTYFELSNHLGNVLAVVTDRKLAQPDGGSGIAFYLPDMVSATDYYPFGMAMAGRGFSTGNYRYGFNGKEKDSEGMGGGGSTYDYGFRIYNPQIARFLSVDPLFRSYAFYSTYQFAGDMPISSVDLDGLEIYFAANGNYIGKWGTNTEVRVLENDKVSSFQQDLQSTNSNPNDFLNQVVMYCYWSGSAGSRSPSTADKDAISKGHVIPTSTHESYSTHGDCFLAACATLANNNYTPGDFWGSDAQYQFQMYKAGKTPNVDIEKTRLAGFEKINSELEAGKPILVGVDYQSGAPEANKKTDNTTDHFIVLTGRGFDDAGNLYYTGFENVDGGDNSNGTSTTLNRFYPQPDGTLQGGTTFTGGMTITQVRPVEEKTN